MTDYLSISQSKIGLVELESERSVTNLWVACWLLIKNCEEYGLLFYCINPRIFLQEQKNNARRTLVMITDFPDIDAKPDTLEYGVKFVATRCNDHRKFFFRNKTQGSWLV